MNQYPSGMSSADMNHVEGVGIESYTHYVQLWITYTGDLPEQTAYELAKDIERVLRRHLDFTPDQIEVEAENRA